METVKSRICSNSHLAKGHFTVQFWVKFWTTFKPRGGQEMNQNPKHQNFQVAYRNCGDTSLTELKNIWV